MKGRSSMDEILDTIRAQHPNFPQLSTNVKNLPLNWSADQMQHEISSSYELLQLVKEHTNWKVSNTYLLEGILEYLEFLSRLNKKPDKMRARVDSYIECDPDLPYFLERVHIISSFLLVYYTSYFISLF